MIRLSKKLCLCIVFTCGFVLVSQAQDEARYDTVERTFGATNINAVTGHGGTSLGMAKDGTWTVLSWPSPSYQDQLGYMTSNAGDAREKPRLGAPEGAGVFFGLRLETAGGTSATHWFRDQSVWRVQQDYGPTDGPNIHTVYISESLGLNVHNITAVSAPRADSSAQVVSSWQIEQTETGKFASATLLSYANFSALPQSHRVPALPFVDWGLDGRNDFACLVDPASNALLFFHPDERNTIRDLTDVIVSMPIDYGSLTDLDPTNVTSAALGETIADLDNQFGPGAYIHVTTLPSPRALHAGQDATDFCGQLDNILDNLLSLADELEGLPLSLDTNYAQLLRCKEETRARAANSDSDAWSAIQSGLTNTQRIALGETNGAMETQLTFEDGRAHAHVIVSLGGSVASSKAALNAVKTDPEQLAIDMEHQLEAWLSERVLPSGSDAVRKVARRALINLRVGTDTSNGAIVASISRQPPYGLDWPRDGAFFNIALELSNQSELAERRAELYDSWQLKNATPNEFILGFEPPVDPELGEVDTYPAGIWENNYYADGLVGGLIRFEIDNIGFALFVMVSHAGWAQDPITYLESRWPSIALAAELLTRWKDSENNLHFPAQEDDQFAYTQTLHGAITTYGSLMLAARAAELIGQPEQAVRWGRRAQELRDAIVDEMWDDGEARLRSDDVTTWNPGSASTGPTAWSVYPFPIFDYGHPKIKAQMAYDWRIIEPTVRLEKSGGAYYLKNVLSFALGYHLDHEKRELLGDWLNEIANHATKGTNHFGETMTVIERDGRRIARQQTATPHLWEGTLFYLAAMALTDPASFFRYETVLPPSTISPGPGPGETWLRTVAVQKEQGDSCGGCSQNRPSNLYWLWGLLLLYLRRKRFGSLT